MRVAAISITDKAPLSMTTEFFVVSSEQEAKVFIMLVDAVSHSDPVGSLAHAPVHCRLNISIVRVRMQDRQVSCFWVSEKLSAITVYNSSPVVMDPSVGTVACALAYYVFRSP